MKSIDELLEPEPGLEYLGLTNLKKVHWNYCTPNPKIAVEKA